MSKNKIGSFFLLSSVALIALVGCQPTTSSSSSPSSSTTVSSSQEDKVVAAIKIVEGSISSSFILGSTINYDTLVIATYNAANTELTQLKYSEHTSEITHSEISTAKVGTGFVFSVTYTVNGKVFAANMTYEVVENADLKVDHIAIVPGSLLTNYVEGSVASYDDLQIYTYNAKGTQLAYLRYSANKDAITLTAPIDTSGVSAKKTFILTYTNADGSFTASLDYSVVSKESTYEATNWGMNSRYTDYLATKGASSASKDGSSAFMGIAPFRIATVNPISLLPVISGFDPVSKSVVTISDYSKVTVRLNKASDLTSNLVLADYFDDPSALTATGKIDFKSGTAGDYVLTYTYDNNSDPASFPEIAYKLSVVEGYNITNAKELSIINNQETYYTGDAALAKSLSNFRSANNIPATDFANVVIQNSIAIKKSDLPDYYVWQNKNVADGGPASSSMVGSLKNQAIVFGHIPTSANPVFSIYGNYNKISLYNVDGDNDSFPFVKETDECKGQEPGTDVNVIPEAGLFGNTYDGADAKSKGYAIHLSDLSALGNQGLSEETTLKKGGVIFFKSHTDSLINNVVVDSFFTGVVNEGGYSYTDEKGVFRRLAAAMSIENSRFHNSFSAMLFDEHGAELNIKNSELLKAGGPLIISQLPTYDIAGKSDEQIDERQNNKVIVDKDSRLENWVTGTGGWFSIYNTSSYMAQLMQFSALFEYSSMKKTFTKTDSDGVTKRLNMIFLTMKSEATLDKIIANDGSLKSSFTLGGKDMIDLEEGRASVASGISAAASDYGASYIASLNSTEYGHLLSMQQYGIPLFKTIDSQNVSHYMSALDPAAQTPTKLINSKFLSDMTTTALDADAGDSRYLSMYLLANANGLNYLPTMSVGGNTIVDASTLSTNYSSYKGVAPMSLVLGMMDSGK